MTRANCLVVRETQLQGNGVLGIRLKHLAVSDKREEVKKIKVKL